MLNDIKEGTRTDRWKTKLRIQLNVCLMDICLIDKFTKSEGNQLFYESKMLKM